MCIYCGTEKYRRIYKNHYGTIPKDQAGRSYEIHHIDGNHSNNDPNNLTAVTLQEHYNIHYAQGDWAAAHRIAGKLELSSETLSELATRSNLRRVESGEHPFLGGEVSRATTQRRLADGTHHFLGDSNPSVRKVKNGSHHFLGGQIQRESGRRRTENGTNPFLGGGIQREAAKRLLATGNHPTQTQKTCVHCGKTVNSINYGRWHGPNCRVLPRNH